MEYDILKQSDTFAKRNVYCVVGGSKDQHGIWNVYAGNHNRIYDISIRVKRECCKITEIDQLFYNTPFSCMKSIIYVLWPIIS